MKYILTLFACFTLSAGRCQQTSSFDKGDLIIRANPLGLLDFVETNASGGAEYRLKSNLSVCLDAAYIMYSTYYRRSDGRSNGFMLRPAIRYYTNPSRRTFVEGEYSFKQVDTKLTDWIGRDCVEDVPTYEELTDFTIRKNVHGLNFKVGWMFPISKNGNLWMELYGGLGVKFKVHSIVNEPMSCYNFIVFPFSENNNTDRLTGSAGSFPAGLRLLFKL